MMRETSQITALINAIRNLHGCEATWIEAVPITETFEDKIVWEGIVHVFALQGHPVTDRAYAWSHAVEGSDKRRFVVVLHKDPINTPQKAVQAAIVQEYREKH